MLHRSLPVFVLLLVLTGLVPGSGVLAPGSVAATVAPIVLDGGFDDWAQLAPDATDPSGDDGSSGIDFGRVWVANDHRFFFVRFETGKDVQGDEQQSMRLYLDTDLDAGTGVAYGGIGADLIWDFGQRSGIFRGTTVGHDDLGMLLAPTVSSTEFEIALRLDAVPAGGQALFPGTSVRLILRDMASGGDRVPDATALTASIDAASTSDPQIGLERFQSTHVRICNYNVLNNGLFEGGAREAAFTRLLTAVDADVWVFNEVWDFSAAATATRLEELLPAGSGRTWQAVKRDSGNVIVSRYPIVQNWEILPGSRLTAARIDLDPDHDRDLLVIAAHFSCCTADVNRQQQADALVGFVRDAMTPGDRIDLPIDTPVVAGGDFNLVGWSQQLETLFTGDIFDEGLFGPDHAPDWDGTGFDLAPSTHTDQRVGYTWRNDFSSFLPGLLDFMFYTGSVVELGNHYILDTRTMRSSSLSQYGLLSGDTFLASDHSIRVTDLVLEAGTAAPPTTSVGARLLGAFPNPFNPRTVIEFELDVSQHVALDVIDLHGRLVRTLVSNHYDAGRSQVVWNGQDQNGESVASGTYLLRLTTGDSVQSSKVLLVR